jgi:hypothetical protein
MTLNVNLSNATLLQTLQIEQLIQTCTTPDHFTVT